MKTLPLKLRKNGFEYTQVCRGRRSCIYEQRVSEKTRYYEVFLIRTKPERVIKGKKIEACEWFPHDEAFGTWAWTYRTYEEAQKKYEKLEMFIDCKLSELERLSNNLETKKKWKEGNK